MQVDLAARPIVLSGTYDVVVAGGGPAGCAAATAAAQEGKRVLLLEATGALGGMGTMGLVPAWCPFSDGEKIIYRGLAEKIFKESKKGCPHVSPNQLDWVPIHPEHLKCVYDDLLEEAGVTVLFFTMVAGVEEHEGLVRRLLCANKNGLTAVEASVYIDCTGDGDICAWAGAPWEKGDATGDMQPATQCFMLGNVNNYAFAAGGKPSRDRLNHLLEQYPRLGDLHLCNCITGPGTVGFNAGHLWDIDGTDPVSLSNAMREGRKIAATYRTALAEALPATFGGATLMQTASLMGIRETRRILGDYQLTIADYLARRSFPDEIARNAYPVDIHTTKQEISAAVSGKVDAMQRFENYRPGESHGIPYRCLIPQKLNNVLVAGRCISTDRSVQASTRVMPVALVMGEAAGVAAALACENKGNTRTVNVQMLRKTLQQRGAYLPAVS